MRLKKIVYFPVLIMLVAACSNKGTESTVFPDPIPFYGENGGDTEGDSSFSSEEGEEFSFANGADISWLSEMEESGIQFFNDEGEEQDLLLILKSKGINSIRLRVWVDPENGWNGIEDVLEKAQRAKAEGMRLLIDFHFSDTWADPGSQTKPEAWKDLNFEDLKERVSSHVTEVLSKLKENNINPEWVQIGNETNNGMLWPDGRASEHMDQFAQLVISGYNAVKDVDGNIKVVVQLSNGFDKNMFQWMFDGLKDNGAEWDIIGMSLYPGKEDWKELSDQCISNAESLIERYGKDIMLCEVGMDWKDSTECKEFLSYIIEQFKGLKNEMGLGVFYWEPEAYKGWGHYQKGAFDNFGKPTIALDAFKADGE